MLDQVSSEEAKKLLSLNDKLFKKSEHVQLGAF